MVSQEVKERTPIFVTGLAGAGSLSLDKQLKRGFRVSGLAGHWVGVRVSLVPAKARKWCLGLVWCLGQNDGPACGNLPGLIGRAKGLEGGVSVAGLMG